ncbi:general substrate transporter [Aspergillus unguis]
MGYLCDARGRKQALWMATFVALVGGALQAGSVSVPMFLVARWLTGYGVGNLVTLVPIMQAEISPPTSRGFLVAQHGVILVLGYAIAGWTGYGCSFASTSFQWRFPLALGCLWPLLLTASLPWIPESPRWLIYQRRSEEAYDILARLHHHDDDPNDHFARLEFTQIVQQVEVDRARSERETVWDLFRIPSYRKRMWCGFFAFFSNESSGILVIYNYSVLIYKGLGQTGRMPLLLSAIYVTLGAFANYISSLLIDRLGRRALFLVGLSGMLISLICEAALWAKYAGTTDRAGLSAALFFIFLHLAFYGCCIDATSFVYAAEIFPTHIRSRGVAWSVGTLFLTTIPYLEAAPTALANIGWKYFLVFIVITLINIPIVYFTFPETKGLSLEEINSKFGDQVAISVATSPDTADTHAKSPTYRMFLTRDGTAEKDQFTY